MFEERFEHRLLGLQHIYDLRGDDVDLKADIRKYSERQKLQDEKDLLGIFVSGHPLERHAKTVDWDNLMEKEKVETAVSIMDFKEFKTKKGDMMASLTVETLEGEKRMVLFPQQYKDIQGFLMPDLIVKIRVYMKTNYQRNQKDFIIDAIKIPKRANKHILDKFKRDTEETVSPTESLENVLTNTINEVPF